MPRAARLILDGVCYHVTARGNEGKEVFKCANDYEKYMSLVMRYKNKYAFKIYCWVLMKNHPHLLLDSDQLSKVMHGINTSYAKYFRFKYGESGHVWQDRYNSYVFQRDQYLINCISYIEYNPVRAGITQRPEDYKWSSYRARVLGQKNELLDPVSL